MEEGSPLTAWGSAAEKPRAARGPGFFVAVLGAVALLAATSSRWGGGDARPSDLAAADRCVSMVKKGACELSDGCIWSGVEASCVARSKSYSTGNDDDDDDGDRDTHHDHDNHDDDDDDANHDTHHDHDNHDDDDHDDDDDGNGGGGGGDDGGGGSDDGVFPRANSSNRVAHNPPAVTKVTVPMSAFLAFPSVVAWLSKQSDITDDPATMAETKAGRLALLQYLPTSFEIEMRADLVTGAIGEAAAEGFVAFNAYKSQSAGGCGGKSTTASWDVVISLDGALQAVTPTKSVWTEDYAHVCGLKNYDEDTILLATDANGTERGFIYKWNWLDGSYTEIGGGTQWGSHDIQWSAEGYDAFGDLVARVGDEAEALLSLSGTTRSGRPTPTTAARTRTSRSSRSGRAT